MTVPPRLVKYLHMSPPPCKRSAICFPVSLHTCLISRHVMLNTKHGYTHLWLFWAVCTSTQYVLRKVISPRHYTKRVRSRRKVTGSKQYKPHTGTKCYRPSSFTHGCHTGTLRTVLSRNNWHSVQPPDRWAWQHRAVCCESVHTFRFSVLTLNSSRHI
jgi:hypothetical protein